jgi:predicted phosphodiesterase
MVRIKRCCTSRTANLPYFEPALPILVFGGPYSNLLATQAIRTEAQRLCIKPHQIICTGDVVAYGAEPEETTQLIRDWGIHVIAGNCEEQLASNATDCGCGFDEGSACDLLSKGWYPFANGRLSAANRAWMGQLPSTLQFEIHDVRFRVIHGGISQNNKFLFASEAELLVAELEKSDADVIIAGHCGLPFLAKFETSRFSADRSDTKRFATGRLDQALWFNPGVIGMPANDGTPDVWYGLITVDAETAALNFATRRLTYDFHAAAAQLRRHGHANGYARTYVTGLWPSVDVLPDRERAATGLRLKLKTMRFKTQKQLVID